MLYFSSKIELDMDQEQEIKNLKRKLLELSYNYYKFRVSLYYKVIFILLFLLLGLIVGFLLCIYNHRTTKTNQKYPSVNL